MWRHCQTHAVTRNAFRPRHKGMFIVPRERRRRERRKVGIFWVLRDQICIKNISDILDRMAWFIPQSIYFLCYQDVDIMDEKERQQYWDRSKAFQNSAKRWPKHLLKSRRHLATACMCPKHPKKLMEQWPAKCREVPRNHLRSNLLCWKPWFAKKVGSPVRRIVSSG